MSVLKGEGTTVMLYGSTSVSTGSRSYPGYLARPDLMGEWPTVVVVPPSSYGAFSSVNAICRVIARHGLAAVAPATGGMDAFIRFITNRAGHWSNAEYGFGILGLGDGSGAAIDKTASLGLVASLALVDPELGDDAVALLDEVAVPLVGFSARDASAVVDEARAAAPHAEWVVYDGAGARYWDSDAEGYTSAAAEDTADRVIEFFARSLPQRV